VLKIFSTIVFVLSFAPHPALAQTFVSAGVFDNIQLIGRSATESPSIDDPNPSGSSLGMRAGGGFFVRDHLVVAGEVAFAAPVKVILKPPELVRPLGQPTNVFLRTSEYRVRQATVMIGYVTRRQRRVAASVLAGIAMEQQRLHTRGEFTNSPGSLTIRTLTTYAWVPVFGSDIDVMIRSHFSLVPLVRLSGISAQIVGTSERGALGIAPGISARWTF
jgi:hypothetical protein